MLGPNVKGFYPYTPGITLMYGLEEALKMLNEEGLDNVFARHAKLASGVRAAVSAWGLENQCRDAKYYSNAVTSIRIPEGYSADRFRKIVLENFNMSLGAGLTKVADKVFRIGHLGDTNELTIIGALGGVEMGLELAGVPHDKGGVDAAMAEFRRWAKKPRQPRPPSAEISSAGGNASSSIGRRGSLPAVVFLIGFGSPGRSRARQRGCGNYNPASRKPLSGERQHAAQSLRLRCLRDAV